MPSRGLAGLVLLGIIGLAPLASNDPGREPDRMRLVPGRARHADPRVCPLARQQDVHLVSSRAHPGLAHPQDVRRHGEGRGMSGHSKWATTKHKKAVVDARRGKLFAKLIKNVRSPRAAVAPTRLATPPSTTPSRRRRRAPSRTTTSTARSGAAAAWRPAEPPTSRSPTRDTPPAGSPSWSSA